MFPLVVEAVPVQNQAASQKLLHKMSQQDGNRRHFNNRNHRGKGRMEDQVVYTLEEYERRKSGTSQLPKETSSYTNHDEELAWQLQNQFDLEDSQVSINVFSYAYASNKASYYSSHYMSDIGCNNLSSYRRVQAERMQNI